MIRKFGTSPDQKTVVDTEDDQGLSKTASEQTPWTPQDQQELQEEINQHREQ